MEELKTEMSAGPSTIDLELPEHGPAIEQDLPTVDPALPDKPAVETVAARTVLRKLRTHILETDDDVPRRYNGTHAQTRRLEQESVRVARDNAFEGLWKSCVVVGRMDNSINDPVERDLEDSGQVLSALCGA